MIIRFFFLFHPEVSPNLSNLPILPEIHRINLIVKQKTRSRSLSPCWFLCYFVQHPSFVCEIIFLRGVMKKVIEWIAAYA